MTTYDIGNKIRVTGTFTNPLQNDAPIDPPTVYCSVRTPTGIITDYTYGVDTDVSKSSTGVYYIDLPLTIAGRWHVRWWGRDAAGNDAVAEEETIKCAEHEAIS